MLNPLLSQQQREIVVFPILPLIPYWKRFLIGFGCILAGFFLQYLWWYQTFFIVVSFMLILAGNLFLVVGGYDNRVKFGKYKPDSGWEPIDKDKLLEIGALVKKMKKWDRSAIDISNKLGVFTLIVIAIIVAIAGLIGSDGDDRLLIVLAGDAILLLFPHWISGTRSIQTQPNLLLKIDLLEELLGRADVKEHLHAHELEYLLLLKSKGDKKVPEDVKLRVDIQNQDPEFLGLYAQIVVNRVKDKKYPYFYVVLVAKKGYGFKQTFTGYTPPPKIIKEFKKQSDVEVLVIRQKTTKTSGYHTKKKTVRRIFLEGLELAEELAVK